MKNWCKQCQHLWRLDGLPQVSQSDTLAVGQSDSLLVGKSDSLTVWQPDSMTVWQLWQSDCQALSLTLQFCETLKVCKTYSLTMWESDSLEVWQSESLEIWYYDNLKFRQSDSLTVWQSDCLRRVTTCGKKFPNVNFINFGGKLSKRFWGIDSDLILSFNICRYLISLVTNISVQSLKNIIFLNFF